MNEEKSKEKRFCKKPSKRTIVTCSGIVAALCVGGISGYFLAGAFSPSGKAPGDAPISVLRQPHQGVDDAVRARSVRARDALGARLCRSRSQKRRTRSHAASQRY